MPIRNNFILNSDYATIKELGNFDKTFEIPQFDIWVPDDQYYTVRTFDFDAPDLNGIQNFTLDFSGNGYRSIRTPNSHIAYFEMTGQTSLIEILAGVRKTTSGKAQLFVWYYFMGSMNTTVTVKATKFRIRGHIFATPFDSE